MDDALQQYIATERARGVADVAIKKALLEKGWDAGKVGAAFGENIVHAAPLAVQTGFFAGRISRKEYLFANILLIILGIVAFVGALFTFGMSFGMMSGVVSEAENFHSAGPLGLILFLVLVVAGFILSLSLMIRRLHDLGREWFWAFLAVIPIVTFFFSLYLLFFKGEQRVNAYGSIPNNSRSIIDVILGR